MTGDEHLPPADTVTSSGAVYRRRTYRGKRSKAREMYITTGVFRPTRKTIRKADVVAVGTLILDFDGKDYLRRIHDQDLSSDDAAGLLHAMSAEDLDQLLGQLRDYITTITPLDPSRVVCSGYGYHLYFWLDYPVDGFPGLVEVQAANKALVSTINDRAGWAAADRAVCNPGERVMRPLGTSNLKGPNPRDVLLVASSSARYTLEDVARVTRTAEQTTEQAPPTPGASYERVRLDFGGLGDTTLAGGEVVSLCTLADRVVEAVQGGHRAPGAHTRCRCPRHGGESLDSAFMRLSRSGQPLLSCSHCETTWEDGRYHRGRLLTTAEAEVNTRLLVDKRGQPRATIDNAKVVLTYGAMYQGRVWYNLMDGCTYVGGRELQDRDARALRERCAAVFGFTPPFGEAHCAFETVAERVENHRHPLRDELDRHRAAHGDGDHLLDAWLGEVFPDASDTALHRAYGRKFLLGLVARAYEPGVKMDTALVVVGGQAARKSTFVEVLGGRYSGEAPIDPRDYKACLEQIAGRWVYEIAEFDRFGPRDQARLKAFITNRSDRYRKAYGRSTSVVQRLTCFVGTANREEILSDTTGSRRYWVIDIGDRVNIEWLKAHRDQLLGQAVEYYNAHRAEPCLWWLTEAEGEFQARANVEDFALPDPWAERVSALFADLDRLGANGIDPDAFTAHDVGRALGTTHTTDLTYALPRALRGLCGAGQRRRVRGVRARFYCWPDDEAEQPGLLEVMR